MDNHERAMRLELGKRDELRVLCDFDPDWLVIFFLAERAGDLVVAEVRVLPKATTDRDGARLRKTLDGSWCPPPPVAPLGTRRLREMLSPAQALAFARQDLPALLPHRVEFHGLDATVLGIPPLRAARKHNSDPHRARVASYYVEAVTTGSPRPREVVAERLTNEGWPCRSADVRDLLVAARKHGLLTQPPTHGKAGGSLTDKARDLLSRTGQQPDEQ